MNPHFGLVSNSAFEKVNAAREPDYFVGPSAQPFASLIVSADRPVVKQSIQQAVSRDKAYVIEYRIRTGQEKWLWEKGVCVRDDQGKQVALEGFIEDITHWKRAEEARVQAERLAAIGSMAAKLAHEIRNPLGIQPLGRALSTPTIHLPR